MGEREADSPVLEDGSQPVAVEVEDKLERKYGSEEEVDGLLHP